MKKIFPSLKKKAILYTEIIVISILVILIHSWITEEEIQLFQDYEKEQIDRAPVKALVVERCDIGGSVSTPVECTWSYIKENEIQMKLLIKKPLAYITKIEVPNEECEVLEVNKLLHYKEELEINIPCTFSKDYVYSNIIIYHISEDLNEDLDISNIKEDEIRGTTGYIEGIVRGSEDSKTEEEIQGLFVEKCEVSSNFLSCYKPSMDKEGVHFYLKNNGQRLNLTKVDLPGIPCNKDIKDVYWDKGNMGEKLISLECNFNKKTITSKIILHAVVQTWDGNFEAFDEPREFVIEGEIGGVVR